MDPRKIQDILSWNTPMSVGDIQSFLGFESSSRPLIDFGD
jgi:hypothetical protein